MTTAYSPILKLALPVTGELDGTWGDVVNNNITSMVEEAIAGLASISTWAGASHTLTTANGTTSEARCAILQCSGAPGAAATVICPAVSKLYVLKNGVDGGYAVTLKTSGGTGIAVPNGKVMWLYCDGTNVVDATTHLSSLTLGSALPVASGGTGAATLTGVIKGNGTSAFTAATAGTDYLAPPSGTALLKANSGGALANAVAGTDYVSPTGTETLTNKTLTSPTINTPTVTNPTVTNYVETTATSTGNTTVDLANGTIFKVTTNGNNTVTLPSSVTGKSFVVIIAYTGAHTITWAGGSTIKWLGQSEPPQTKINGRLDIFTFIQDGTNTYGSAYGLGF